ncbi:hypothetical protein HO133_002474 [Letharia lupina]|uniref:Gfd2/YDR514C-like C-terminal domain-containing protein n=1 Tax=Letharia lupina TaxID=560253 RepID=A0A8H6CCM8_9LECA|nr:uncharacterized protein HO133_002474 [Letharia lupina]KAF6220794.1 hypothetical protein HO133_002474 [Letharia lupina]
MTVRGATQRESPDGHVLFIEEVRKHLGVRANAGESSSLADTTEARPKVLLIGHDMHDDFRKMRQDGIDLQKHFQYSGCVDTQVVVEDTGASMGKGLSDLMSHYGLAKLEFKKVGCPKMPGKWVFVGAHCSGNDAVAALECLIDQTFDLSLRTPGDKDSVGLEDLPEDWLKKPLQGMNMDLILLSYDTEGVETPNYKPKVLNRTSEHGFAWMRVADFAHTPPGDHGQNWRSFIRARHWINHDFRNFSNWFYCIGNPKGFWPKYGESQYYHVSEGPAPFHKLFEELANATAGALKGLDTVEEVTAMLEQTTLEEERTPAGGRNMAITRGNANNVRGNMTNSRSMQPPFRSNAKNIGEDTAEIRGNYSSWAEIAEGNEGKKFQQQGQ